MLFPIWLNKGVISELCFNKTKSWIYMKLNNTTVKRHYTQEFTKQEREYLAQYLEEKQEELDQFINILRE